RTAKVKATAECTLRPGARLIGWSRQTQGGTGMADMMRAMNPTAAITNAGEAKAAARASAIAIFLGVIWGVVGLIWMMGPGAAVLEAAMAEATASSPEAAGMAGMAAGMAIGFAGLLVACQLILGLVQWFKPNIVIP